MKMIVMHQPGRKEGTGQGLGRKEGAHTVASLEMLSDMFDAFRAKYMLPALPNTASMVAPPSPPLQQPLLRSNPQVPNSATLPDPDPLSFAHSVATTRLLCEKGHLELIFKGEMSARKRDSQSQTRRELSGLEGRARVGNLQRLVQGNNSSSSPATSQWIPV
jgi:hypothetical protein